MITKQVSTTYINHAPWHWWLRLWSLDVGGNRSTQSDLQTIFKKHLFN